MIALAHGCRHDPAQPPISILVFSRTAAFRHDSIPAGVAALTEIAASRGWRLVTSEDAAVFADDATLARHDVVVWLNTSGDVLDRRQQDGFERYLRAGGGYVGVHGAADTEYDWPWYGELVVAYFANHPTVQSALVRVEDAAHPATIGMPSSATFTDEWYNYRSNPRAAGAHVVLTLDEASYQGGTMGPDHPIAWYHTLDRGRAFYTGLGHTIDEYADPAFRKHLEGAIAWASGR